jgi:thiamine pyrophosphate-dependent acetolactate synthase large subunit-like protein
MNSSQVFEILDKKFGKETAYICSLGRTAELGFNYFPSQTLFLDCMGGVVSTAVGIALGFPNSVVALDTDGSHLMGISILPSLSAIKMKLSNLTIVVIDNEILESGGGLKSRYCKIDWNLLGQAFEMDISVVEDINALEHVFDQPKGFKYIIVKVKNESPSICKKDIDGIESKYLFLRHLEKYIGTKIISPSVKN